MRALELRPQIGAPMKLLQLFAIIVGIMAVINFLLLLFRKVDHMAFWILTAVFAFAAYVVIPKIKQV